MGRGWREVSLCGQVSVCVILPIMDLILPTMGRYGQSGPQKQKGGSGKGGEPLLQQLFFGYLADVFFFSYWILGLATIILLRQIQYKEYAALLNSEWFSIRRDYGYSVVIFTLLCPWVADAGALLAGATLGTRKPFPLLSPNKTMEGTRTQYIRMNTLHRVLGHAAIHLSNTAHTQSCRGTTGSRWSLLPG
eukprot:Protomagalhaensia_sp_Gyna_25__2525@NODE_2424_length_1092_cov_2_939221_g2007_i0_p1_GENE_NODE_2424_length_1092_cov_2_939221_g2007_i0NODE_2424_length_1092_cov_2_939221_g2007_i0_p1_ORF_typecomplete_len191_score5_52CTP_transf_1/PF01148_20/4_2e13_NODE_2424_length_1092_cov_2_939221_g2007_i0315887